jgi:hypothetical protein
VLGRPATAAGVQVVTAALGLLLEVPEFAPEHLIRSLEPHMLQVAAAAVRAASGGLNDIRHAAAWVSAFSSYAAAVPDMLLAAGEDEGSTGEDLRQALLQVNMQHARCRTLCYCCC